MGERTPLALISSPAAARMAVGEAITNIAAAPVARLQDIRLSANGWQPRVSRAKMLSFDAVRAVGMELCPELGISIPVGKDSMSMQTRWHGGKSVTSPLSLIISAFAPLVDVRNTLTPELKTDVESVLVLLDLSQGQTRLGGSILAQCYEQMGDTSPDLDEPRLVRAFFDFWRIDENLFWHTTIVPMAAFWLRFWRWFFVLAVD